MKKLNSRIKIGTLVKLRLQGLNCWYVVTAINENRIHFKAQAYNGPALVGEFQAYDALKFTNKI